MEDLEARLEAIHTAIERSAHETSVAIAEQRAFTEHAFDKLETQLTARMDARFERMDARFDLMDARFDRMEGTLERFIDTQTEMNQIMDRRLRRLEQGAPGDA